MELTLPPVYTGRNFKNGRWLKGVTPFNKGKKWSEYMSEDAQRRSAKEYWDGKNISTGEVTRYYPKRYDKGGWNSPDIKWWLDLDLLFKEGGEE